MPKKCHACGANVPEDHIGKCPNCGEEKGYLITRMINETVSVHDAVNAELKKIQPEAISKTFELLAKRQEELKKVIAPLVELQNSPLVKQLSALQNSPLVKQLSELQKTINSFNFEKIKIPKLEFTVDDILPKETKQKDLSVDVILSKAAEKKPELKEAIESKQQIDDYNKKLDSIETQLNTLTKESKLSGDNITNSLKGIATKQEKTVSIINQKLSPKQTIGVALITGIAASFVASALFALWIQAGEIVAKTPLVNSTMP